MKFQSTKKLGPISVGHRQWRDDGHCAWVHGYGRYIQFTFEGDLDERQWVMDFGDLKDIKQWLEEQWDHRVMIASDDPQLDKLKEMHDLNIMNINVMDVEKGWGPGIEASCKFVYDHVQPIITQKTNGRVKITKVEIWEHERNSAVYTVG
jgi:6-pyruvoyltetrahydropterin/6-carboxytetrahydropterin synthase|tara:strand:+ start:258 stop:707 length:450 start_codon:yes stop_codon:yes gene_type:complete